MERLPVYQAITSINPYVVKEYIDLRSAIQIESICIIKKMYVKTHITQYGNEYDIFNYLILDNKYNSEIKSALLMKKWKIADIYPGYFGTKTKYEGTTIISNWATWNDYVFADSKGEIKTLSYSSLEKAIQILIMLSKNSTWESLEKRKKSVDLYPS